MRSATPASFFKTSMIFAIGGICSILLIEVLLRSIEKTPLWQVLPVVERELGLPDPHLGYRFQANHEIINVRENRARVSTNSLGMRDRPRALDKSAGVFRVALMGDSFTEALQVDLGDTFAAQTETALNSTMGARRYEILNFGMSGFGPLQQLLRYQLDAKKFTPDLGIFVIGVNDFLTQELSNDGSGPAYVESATGDLEIGNAYRNLRSHKIAQSFMGQVFFWAMDYSRIARAAYLYLKVGNQVTATSAPSTSQPSCRGLEQTLLAHKRLWIELQPQPAGKRLEKLLEDVSQVVSESTNTPITFALYGIPVPASQCIEQLTQRSELIAGITAKLRNANIGLIDMESALVSFDEQRYRQRGFHGFGAKMGHGHLNGHGHQAFANLLTKHVKEQLN